MKVLVTGASGFLGNVVLKKISKIGYDSLGISKSKTTKISNIKIIKCDITNLEQITNVIQNYSPHVIIHLAGLTGNVECEQNPTVAFLTNVLGTLNILNSIKQSKTKIIFASSREVYGNVSKPVIESDKLKPININGFTKILSENLIYNFHEVYKIPFIILRFTNFYGLTTNRGISSMMKKAIIDKSVSFYGGDQVFDLIHIDDAATAIVQSIKYKHSDIFNIGSGQSTTLKEIIKKMQKKVDKKIKIEFKPY